jgi:phosphatidate cytidylyltransferase
LAAGELVSRVLVALAGIPVVLGALYVGGWVFGVLIAGAAVLATGELYGLAAAQGIRPFGAIGMAASGAIVLIATALPTPAAAAPAVLMVLIGVTLVALAGSVWLRWPEGAPLAAVAVTVTGAIYVGCTLAFAVFLRGMSAGVTEPSGLGAAVGFVLLPLVATWVGDSAAYFAGRAWGRAKLFPTASPGKTVVGGVAGLIGSGVAGGIVAALALSAPTALRVSVPMGVLVGVLLGLITPIGDVAESVLKREAGTKDSGRLLPGHGGFLDRVDSLLFALPVAYGLFAVLGVIPLPGRLTRRPPFSAGAGRAGVGVPAGSGRRCGRERPRHDRRASRGAVGIG